MHIAVLTEFPIVCFANGRGHRIIIIVPRPGPDAPPAAPGTAFLDAVPS